MVLAPTLITTSELRIGSLVDLLGSQPIAMGSYRIMAQPDRRKLVHDFCKWLRYEARGGTAEY
jgi:LysR family glycine cleavage system transcriptional activator